MIEAQASTGADVVRTFHDAYNRRDEHALLGCLAETVVWHSDGDSPFSGTFTGRDAVWADVLDPLWESPARVRDDTITQHGDHVVALQHAVHNFGDGEQAWPAIEVCRIEDGAIAERWEFTSDRASLDALLNRGCPADNDGA